MLGSAWMSVSILFIVIYGCCDGVMQVMCWTQYSMVSGLSVDIFICVQVMFVHVALFFCI